MHNTNYTPPSYNHHYEAAPTNTTTTTNGVSIDVADGSGGGDVDDAASSVSLWDQLNDEQSREVQQHQSRFHAIPNNSRSHHGVVFMSMVTNTFNRTSTAISSAYHAAKHAWIESRHNNNNNLNSQYYPFSRYNHRRHNRHHNLHHHIDDDTFLDREFGIARDLQPDVNMTDTLLSGDELRRQQQQRQQNNEEHNTNDNDDNDNDEQEQPMFVLLNHFRLTTSSRDGWGAVSNLDLFLTNLYNYYYHRGLIPIVCKGILEIITLIFTLCLSVFLLQYVDWSKLVTCKDEHTCYSNVSDYIIDKPFHKHWTLWNLLIHGYTIFFTAYTVFTIWSFYQTIINSLHIKFVIEEKLGISSRKLLAGAISWDTVVERLIQVQESGDYRISIYTGQPLDALIIAHRILRKENFLIALFNTNNNLLLDNLTLYGRIYFCKTLQWSIYFCILNFMFNHKYEVRPAFYLDPMSLKRRFIVCGILHAICLPFLLVFLSLHFLIHNLYDFKTSRQYMGKRDWSLAAKWMFREYNELQHIFDKRLEPSYDNAEEYIKLFGQSEILATIGQLLVFLGSAFGGILLVIAAILNDAILLHVQLQRRNLLWYAGIAGIIYSVGKSIVPTKESQPSVTRNLFDDMNIALTKVISNIHYCPESWKGRGWDSNVKNSFSKLIDSKVKLFIYELLSVIIAPYILCFQLPKSAEYICEFILVLKCRIPGIGDICGYSNFDFTTYGDEAWDGRTLGKSIMMNNNNNASSHSQQSLAESIVRLGNVEDATRRHPKPKAKQGKMEKSFFNFQSAHPSWNCKSESGRQLNLRVEEYRKAELAAMARERELHIVAAAKQLETLAKLEQQQQEQQQQQHLLQQNHPNTTTTAYGLTNGYNNNNNNNNNNSNSVLGTIHETNNNNTTTSTTATATTTERVPPADAGAGSQSQEIQQQQQQQQSVVGNCSTPSSPAVALDNMNSSMTQQPNVPPLSTSTNTTTSIPPLTAQQQQQQQSLVDNGGLPTLTSLPTPSTTTTAVPSSPSNNNNNNHYHHQNHTSGIISSMVESGQNSTITTTTGSSMLPTPSTSSSLVQDTTTTSSTSMVASINHTSGGGGGGGEISNSNVNIATPDVQTISPQVTSPLSSSQQQQQQQQTQHHHHQQQQQQMHLHQPQQQQLHHHHQQQQQQQSQGLASSALLPARDTLRASLSTEIRHILSMSTMDASDNALLQQSVVSQQSIYNRHSDLRSSRHSDLHRSNHLLPPPPPTETDRIAERQYYWLERFRAHMEAERRQEFQQQRTRQQREVSRSLPF